MLTSIEIDNYKSIAHADLKFASETVIVGPNGTGKSNLLDAVHFLRDAATDGLDHAVTRRHGINSIRRWSKTRPYHVSLKMNLSSGDEHGHYRIVISSAGGDFSISEEEASWTGVSPFNLNSDNEKDETPKTFRFMRSGNEPIKFEIPDDPFGKGYQMILPDSELAIQQLSRNYATPYSFFFHKLQEEIASCGAYSIYPNKIREPQSLSNAEVLFDDGSNLASIIRNMRTTARNNKDNLTKALKQVLPIVSEIHINSAGGFFVPTFRVKEMSDGHAHDLNMSQISDGTLRMLGMLTAFYQPNAPRRITLEEPEQMIHPGLLPILVDAARDFLDINISERQIFFTTHSPILLDLFEPASIVSTTFRDGITEFAPLSTRQMQIVKDRLFSAGQLLVAEGLFA